MNLEKTKMKNSKKIIQTHLAPTAIGSYSQAIQVSNTLYLSGQIPLDPVTMLLVEGDITAQITRVFENLKQVTIAAGGDLNDIVKLTVYLIDLSHITLVNELMENFFERPFPARTSIQISALPKNSSVEIDAIMVLPNYTKDADQ